ncbi:hypothetical protein GCM10023189_32050 [Nibrella saemangeumensis]|uniref:Cytochrome P460 n=1 Tax=Nibrella saemangeumensis TaxID=1084526 RepID=A0ABP8N2R6_9BACT
MANKYIGLAIIAIAILLLVSSLGRPSYVLPKLRELIKVNGQIRNYSSKSVWVIVFNHHLGTEPVAYKLAPNYKSPDFIDADAVKTADDTTRTSHTGWIKITDISHVNVQEDHGRLTVGCLACWFVEENRFGKVVYDTTTKWGDPL